MNEKKIMRNFGLKESEIDELAAFLDQNGVPYSKYAANGSLVMDDILAMEYVPLFKESKVQNSETVEYPSNAPSAGTFSDSLSFSTASGADLPYVVFQVTLKEKFLGTGSGNLTELERVLNHFYRKGYRLHTMATSESGSKGALLGDRIQATLVFEKVDLFK